MSSETRVSDEPSGGKKTPGEVVVELEREAAALSIEGERRGADDAEMLDAIAMLLVKASVMIKSLERRSLETPPLAEQDGEQHADDCAWNRTRLTLQRQCTCGALDTPPSQALNAGDVEAVAWRVGASVVINGTGTAGVITEVAEEKSLVYFFNKAMERHEEYWFAHANLTVALTHPAAGRGVSDAMRATLSEILDEDAPNKWVWKTFETQDEWLRTKILPLLRQFRASLSRWGMSARRLPILYTPLTDVLSIVGQVGKGKTDGLTDESRAVRVLASDGVLDVVQRGLLGIVSRREVAAAKHYEALRSINDSAEKEMRELVKQVETMLEAEPSP